MLDIFEILGPIMVGPSSSHTAGAVRIGRMARTLLGEPPVKADIGLYGSFAETGRGHGTDRALVAGLLGMKPDDLRIPESFSVAKEQGLSFVFHPAELREAHPNTAVLTVEGASGKKTKVQAASIGGGRIRVDQLDGVAVDFTGIFNTLIVRHMDVPGELATPTTWAMEGWTPPPCGPTSSRWATTASGTVFLQNRSRPSLPGRWCAAHPATAATTAPIRPSCR